MNVPGPPLGVRHAPSYFSNTGSPQTQSEKEKLKKIWQDIRNMGGREERWERGREGKTCRRVRDQSTAYIPLPQAFATTTKHECTTRTHPCQICTVRYRTDAGQQNSQHMGNIIQKSLLPTTRILLSFYRDGRNYPTRARVAYIWCSRRAEQKVDKGCENVKAVAAYLNPNQSLGCNICTLSPPCQRGTARQSRQESTHPCTSAAGPNRRANSNR